jgi:CheY-like chemotaxis protein
MPVMDTYEFLDRARQNHLIDNIPVIVLTAHPSLGALGAKVTGKPIKPERFLPLVRQLIGD